MREPNYNEAEDVASGAGGNDTASAPQVLCLTPLVWFLPGKMTLFLRWVLTPGVQQHLPCRVLFPMYIHLPQGTCLPSLVCLFLYVFQRQLHPTCPSSRRHPSQRTILKIIKTQKQEIICTDSRIRRAQRREHNQLVVLISRQNSWAWQHPSRSSPEPWKQTMKQKHSKSASESALCDTDFTDATAGICVIFCPSALRWLNEDTEK